MQLPSCAWYMMMVILRCHTSYFKQNLGSRLRLAWCVPAMLFELSFLTASGGSPMQPQALLDYAYANVVMRISSWGSRSSKTVMTDTTPQPDGRNWTQPEAIPALGPAHSCLPDSRLRI